MSLRRRYRDRKPLQPLHLSFFAVMAPALLLRGMSVAFVNRVNRLMECEQ